MLQLYSIVRTVSILRTTQYSPHLVDTRLLRPLGSGTAASYSCLLWIPVSLECPGFSMRACRVLCTGSRLDIPYLVVCPCKVIVACYILSGVWQYHYSLLILGKRYQLCFERLLRHCFRRFTLCRRSFAFFFAFFPSDIHSAR